LLEVLDPEQNNEFRDNYIEVGLDLSQVMFITTANQLETIPAPLLDRMEIIRLSGYTEQEKLAIAKQYLIPRQLRENGLLENEAVFQEEAISYVIQRHTREAGVRNLEREIGAICRKIATHISEHRVNQTEITPEIAQEFLGRPKYFVNSEVQTRTKLPGVATGLAWTPVGGDILFIEATRMSGSKGFQVTGSIGKVMQESAQAALSYVRSHASEYQIDPEFYNKTDLHLHIPAGAQPKDGPSAGVTIVTALVSLLTDRCVKSNVGMTGEITLRGQVLPIGGVKEKILAAHRAGLDTIFLPKENEPDLEDIPEEMKKQMHFIFVDTINEIIAGALEENHHSCADGQTEKSDEQKDPVS